VSITIQLDLPDTLLNETRANGLLDSASMGRLIAAELTGVLEGIRAQPGEPMSKQEIVAEVKAVRRERRAGEAGR
jgi:hypothetical protein